MISKLTRMKLAVATLAFGVLGAGPLAFAEPERSPEQVIQDASDEAMEALKNRRDELKADRKALFELVDEILLPRWDRQYTGQLIMGRYWREATREQREAFISGLYRKLLDSYGDGLLQYEANQMRILGTRGNPAEGRVMVDTEVRLDDGTRVPISYRLRVQDDRWKVYDVVVEGISYVTNFRNQYASELRSKGIERVLEELGADDGDGGS
jgi:phospholipid transport system substrate-binding protein